MPVMDCTGKIKAKVRLTTFNNINISGLEQFHAESVYDKIQSNQFSSMDKLRDKTVKHFVTFP